MFAATDLRRSDRADGKYKRSHKTPTFTLTFARLLKLYWPGNVAAELSLANSPRSLRITTTRAFTRDIKINPFPWNVTQTAIA